jgi:hypothetical protein
MKKKKMETMVRSLCDDDGDDGGDDGGDDDKSNLN